jgi:hypothetical protein
MQPGKLLPGQQAANRTTRGKAREERRASPPAPKATRKAPPLSPRSNAKEVCASHLCLENSRINTHDPLCQ